MSLRVLIVEDEALVAFMIEDAVEEAGHTICSVVSNLTDAIQAVSNSDFDVALLDMNLNGQKAHSLPVILSARNKPFAFVTGYGEPGILERFADAPLVTKPFRKEAIVSALAKLQQNLPTSPGT